MLLLQHESDLHVDLVANYVAVLYQDVLVLHPATLHASKRLGGSGDSLVDGVLEARLGCSAQLSDSGNTHRYLCLLILACCLMSHLWPNEVDGKHQGRDILRGVPATSLRAQLRRTPLPRTPVNKAKKKAGESKPRPGMCLLGSAHPSLAAMHWPKLGNCLINCFCWPVRFSPWTSAA